MDTLPTHKIFIPENGMPRIITTKIESEFNINKTMDYCFYNLTIFISGNSECSALND